MNLFTSLDPAVKKLLGWKMGDEEEKWALKAVESLVKKMQKRKSHGYGTVEDLEYALSHPGSSSNCVTIPRSLDGRLQVSHRKALPHVIYCRVWRWPNLQSHQIRPLVVMGSMPQCLFPYDGRNEQICINPYHYHRIDIPGHHSAKPSTSSSSVMPLLFCASSISSGIKLQQQQIPHGTNSSMPSLSMPSCAQQMSSSRPFTSTVPPLYNTNNMTTVIAAGANVILPHNASTASSCGGVQCLSTNGTAATATASFTQSPSALSDDDDFVMHQQQQQQQQQQQFPQHQICWCSVCYYELNSRVGEPFKVFESAVVVDGFTNPSSEGRICLGLLSNVNRNATIENTRRHIGMGIRMMCTARSVLLLNQSEAAVFVQSRNANFKYALQPTAVCRVPPGATMLIFDYHIFSGMLEKAKEDGYQHVYEIVKMCFVRLSFVKGWGADYPRQDVTSTPCWLEIQLHQPMAWIDAALAQLDPPDHNAVTSVS